MGERRALCLERPLLALPTGSRAPARRMSIFPRRICIKTRTHLLGAPLTGRPAPVRAGERSLFAAVMRLLDVRLAMSG